MKEWVGTNEVCGPESASNGRGLTRSKPRKRAGWKEAMEQEFLLGLGS